VLKDFNISISTENGTGSMTANKFLSRCLSKEGFLVSTKNLFPSNIAGLPTTYSLRLTDNQLGGYTDRVDLYVGFNKKTLDNDLEKLPEHTTCILNGDFKGEPSKHSTTQISCRSLVRDLHSSASIKKLLYNLLYAGAVLKAVDANIEDSVSLARSFFKKLPEDILTANIKALEIGYESYDLEKFSVFKKDKIDDDTFIFEGNINSALGFLDGGATVATWYPITPSSSVVESFDKLNSQMTKDSSLRSTHQCEDEISSAVAALGAGWSGARAFTATSGPGLSLMQEAIGLGYFSESPFVILDVQRSGPSTGLPTRTSQADLILAHYSSHGDTLHPVLLPGTPQEAYDDAYESLNLADNLQTPVMILSDLDLGMNEWRQSTPLIQNKSEISKGSVQLEPKEDFKRFSNAKAVSTRSIPRLSDESLAYFTRGSGHDEKGDYSESSDVYTKKLSRLKDKVLKFRDTGHAPRDIIIKKEAELSVVVWGSTGQIYEELKNLLGFEFSYMRVRALPASQEAFDFLRAHALNFVVELNRDGQLNQILKSSTNSTFHSHSINQFGGLPANAKVIAQQITDVFERRGLEQQKQPD
jgi:2-oxoglutarate ferredoxin oxidoreductase subunit alpha